MSGSPSTEVIYPRSVRALILGKYTMQNQKVAEHYLQRGDKVLFRDLSMANSPASIEQPLEAEQLLAFARALIAEFTTPEPSPLLGAETRAPSVTGGASQVESAAPVRAVASG
jgi:hypothetical protein